jgi:NADH:ubiquinone oxidoreductase subunit F (NADH-binding)
MCATTAPCRSLPSPPTGKPGALVDELQTAGLRGRGGGWFPTSRKFHAVVESAAARHALSGGRRSVVIANAMEGEPASSKDAVLLSHSPHLVLDGIQAAARTIGATNAYIAVHRGSPLIATIDAAIAERGSLDTVPVELITPPARYVASEESALAHWAGDGVATPVYGERPFQSGMNGRPTLVQNAETLAHIALIARHGGAWFASVGDPAAPGTTLVSVGGAVAHARRDRSRNRYACSRDSAALRRRICDGAGIPHRRLRRCVGQG